MIEFVLSILIIPTLFLIFLTFIFGIPKNKTYLTWFYIIQYKLFNSTSDYNSIVVNDMINMCTDGQMSATINTHYIHFYYRDKLYCSLYINGKYFFYGTLTWPDERDNMSKRYSPNVSTFLRLIKFEDELRNKI